MKIYYNRFPIKYCKTDIIVLHTCKSLHLKCQPQTMFALAIARARALNEHVHASVTAHRVLVRLNIKCSIKRPELSFAGIVKQSMSTTSAVMQIQSGQVLVANIVSC